MQTLNGFLDMNAPQTTVTPVRAADEEDIVRLPWTAPVLGVYDTERLTLGDSNQSTDGFVNTHS